MGRRQQRTWPQSSFIGTKAEGVANMEPVLQITVEELQLLCEAILAFLGTPLPGDPVSLMKTKSSLNNVKSFVGQSSYWRQLERQHRETTVAVSTLMPDVHALEKELQEANAELRPSSRFVSSLKLWDEALPAG